MDFTVRGRISPQADRWVGLLGIFALVVLWCALTYSGLVKSVFLPTPSGIWQGLVDFQNKHWLFPAIGKSLWRVTRSLLLVIMVGVPIGVIMGTFAPADAFLRKIVNGAKSLPTTGIVGLIVLWFSVEERAKIVFLFLGTVFYMIILVKNAILDVSEDYLRVALDLGANRWQVISKVLLKAALPQIWDAIAVCNGIMWTYIVLAEFINSSEEQLGVGYLLFLGSRTGGSGKVYAMLLIIATISVLTDFMLRSVKKKFFYW
ncbi:MAG TPA: ABC transporter permease subunit [Candidatus Angelobacter sp.]|jgi:NitT/TauT family transport system permease protein|nr:ABC transporter permease subunit [Candidatus Angelobacter sp.]